jgi:hypothetical protein
MDFAGRDNDVNARLVGLRSAAAAQEVKRVQFLQGRLAVDIPARELFGSSSDARFFTFESSSQLTRMVPIRFANDTVTYYQFAKSSNVRENGVYRRQLDERSRRYFRHDVGGWRAVSRHQG